MVARMRFWKRELPDESIAAIVRKAIGHQHEDRRDKVWEVTAPLRKVHRKQRVAAQGLAMLLRGGAFDAERGLELAREIFDSRGDEAWAAAAIGDATEHLHDVRYLNGAPPDDPLFESVARRLEAMAGEREGEELTGALEGLTTAARVMGRRCDDVAESAHRRLIELDPGRWELHYNVGLFFKTRGRFAEGVEANQRAVELGGGDSDGVMWNLGICATGAGDAGLALETWKSLGQKIEMGRYDLPEGGYHPVKVRLAEFPMASRGGGEPDRPGHEETVFVERLSPCHGVVRSAPFEEMGVGYGDVVLFDGAAITFHDHDGERVPVFPQLITLSREGYQAYPFAGSQGRDDEIVELSAALTGDAVVYVHAEEFRDLQSVVTGVVCAPPDLPAAELRAELDRALDAAPDVELFAPQLSRAAGDAARADDEQRRLTALAGEPTSG